ncbi:uncharacterized protein LOC120928296 [Rana temporaria]|uniref:uncharacterized protein LOC120928296 n=1 Tax=Rana temporaria TaxID=8407 RepID=UPI001AAD79F1|nr:uncharacterized protein LOC120928296 [Rana temporaria]
MILSIVAVLKDEKNGKLVTLLNSDGVPLKTKYNVDHLKPFLRSKSEDKEGDDKAMETPKGHSCTNTPLQRHFAPEVLKDNTKFKCYGRKKSLEAVVGPYPLFVSSFQALRAKKWLVDEVIHACLYHILKNQHKSICQICAVVATTLFNGQIEKLGKDIFPEDIWVCPINFGQHWILVLFLMKGYDGRQSNAAKRGILRVVKRRMWLKFQHKRTVLQMYHFWSDFKRRREGFLRTVCCRIPATSGGRRPQVTLTISPAGRRTACLSYVAAGAPNFQRLKVIHEQGDQAQQASNPSDVSDEEGAEVESASPEESTGIGTPDMMEEEDPALSIVMCNSFSSLRDKSVWNTRHDEGGGGPCPLCSDL